MKIQNIAFLYSPLKFKQTTQNQSSPKLQLKGQLSCDVISFRAKTYTNVANPTNHCAYCGCKLYNEAQIDSLAKEMLKNNSHRLQGDIKSALEKLESAQRSEELTAVKQIVNKKEIEFYRKFLQQAKDKSFLKGEAIFEQVYNMNYDEALAELKRNLRPLTKTIDHVSPQNLNEENKDEDINLVEACYCCNHDLKKGMPFSNFYRLYPSIEENMPYEKLKYARAQIVSSSDVIFYDISSQGILDFTSGLITRRNNHLAQLDTVNYRILESLSTIAHKIKECEAEIEEKEKEILGLNAKQESMANDVEYLAMFERISLQQKQEQIEHELSILRENRKNISIAKNELENPPKKAKKSKVRMSEDEKKQKIASYRQQIIDLNQEIQQKESEAQQVQEELALLDTQYPTPEILQSRKNSFDAIVNAYSQLEEEESRLDVLNGIAAKLQAEIKEIEEELLRYPTDSFDISSYSLEEKQIYAKYSELLKALKYAEQFINNSNERGIVSRCAKVQIEEEMAKMSGYQVVIDSTNFLRRKELLANKEKTQKEFSENEKAVIISQRKIEQLKRTTSRCSLEEAKKQSVEVAKWIRSLNDKQNYLQIPKVIEKLEAEILLLNKTIGNLRARTEEIEKLNLTLA